MVFSFVTPGLAVPLDVVVPLAVGVAGLADEFGPEPCGGVVVPVAPGEAELLPEASAAFAEPASMMALTSATTDIEPHRAAFPHVRLPIAWVEKAKVVRRKIREEKGTGIFKIVIFN